jgi:hypothetical protein
MKLTKSIALVSMLAFSGAAWAQAPAMPTAPTAPAMPAAPSAPAMTKPAMPATPAMKKPRSAKSLDCSKQADSQTLHGKPRKDFMSKCKKG